MKANRKRIESICKQILNSRHTADKTKHYNTLVEYCDKCGIEFSNALEGGLKLAKNSIACQSLGIQEV